MMVLLRCVASVTMSISLRSFQVSFSSFISALQFLISLVVCYVFHNSHSYISCRSPKPFLYSFYIHTYLLSFVVCENCVLCFVSGLCRSQAEIPGIFLEMFALDWKRTGTRVLHVCVSVYVH